VQDEPYSYITAGFDDFLTRSIDVGVGSTEPLSRQIAFDRTQVSGFLGDTLQLGKISLNGSQGNIIMNDGNNDVLLIGDDNAE
jgi:hypothetical protein